MYYAVRNGSVELELPAGAVELELPCINIKPPKNKLVYVLYYSFLRREECTKRVLNRDENLVAFITSF